MSTYVLPINRPKRRYVIGIDPDKNESGFAVYDRQTRSWVTYKALLFPDLQTACFDYKPDECEVHIEAGWLNDGMNKYQSKTLPKDFDTWSRARREAYIFQRGCDVGVNFGAGHAITHVLKANGFAVYHYCPQTAKWDHALQMRITGITKRVNQDVRDAIRAAYLNR